TADQLALVSAWYWVVNLFLAKRIITLYHAGQKLITKDQHALVIDPVLYSILLVRNKLATKRLSFIYEWQPN
uniref:hypothetical protein n=1 Tax=Marisediminitalea sp. TaxID=2662268 RepID=UPI00243A71D6